MGTGYSGGVQRITEPTFVRAIDVTLADFDGTDTAAMAATFKTQETNNSAFNPWKKNGGFVFSPSASGVVDVLSWEDYERNAKVVDDALKQSVQVQQGEWHKTKVVKVYTTSAVKTMTIGQVL